VGEREGMQNKLGRFKLALPKAERGFTKTVKIYRKGTLLLFKILINFPSKIFFEHLPCARYCSGHIYQSTKGKSFLFRRGMGRQRT
jgi:hypothetical protein